MEGTLAQPSTVELAIPAVGVYMSDDHRYWHNGRGPLPGVTGLLDVLDKPAVNDANVRKAVQATIDAWRAGELPQLADKYTDHGIAELMRSAPQAQMMADARKGSAIHAIVDAAGRSQDASGDAQCPPEYQDALRAFRGFLGRYSVSIVSSEKAVIGEGYAGTFDMLASIAGELWLIDVKTGRGFYPEFALQLAAYGHALGIALPNDPQLYPLPTIERWGVLHLRPELYPDTGYRLVEYAVTGADYVAFLAAMELSLWRKEGRHELKQLRIS